jgi:acylglycerol lipase
MIDPDIFNDVSDVKHEEYIWYSYDKKELYVQSWLPEKKLNAIILLAHDYGEHSGRYRIWSAEFVKKGYGVIAFDYRGHGKSEGKKGHASSYFKFQKDLVTIITNVQQLYGDKPLYFYGQGFGANIILNYIINQPQQFAGVIVASPWFEMTEIPNYILYSLGNSVKNILPNLMIKTGINPEALSRDIRIIHDYKKDPLNHNKISLRLFYQTCEAGKRAMKSIYKINIPMLVLHGTGDTYTSCRASNDFVRNSGQKTKFIQYNEGLHQLHNDICNELVLSDILEWLEKTLQKNKFKPDVSASDNH